MFVMCGGLVICALVRGAYLETTNWDFLFNYSSRTLYSFDPPPPIPLKKGVDCSVLYRP
jgi:hypothetical protein